MPRSSKLFLPFAFGDKMFNAYHLYASPRGFISYVDLPNIKNGCYFAWVGHLFQHLMQMEVCAIKIW